MNAVRRNPLSSSRQHGGIVSVTPVRDQSGEGESAFAISYHSPGGDLAWLSPRIASEDHADVAALCIADLTGSTVRR